MEYDRIFDVKIGAEAIKLSRKFGVLPYMAQRYILLFGAEGAESFLEAAIKGIPRSIRCNTLTMRDCGELVRRMEERGFSLRRSRIVPYGYYVEHEPFSLGSSPEHLQGHFFIQGVGSMASVVALSPKPGESVADLASAPGGKTTHMAQLMRNEGRIMSVDVDAKRISKLISNIERMHVRNAVVVLGDTLKIKFGEGSFDRVMLDAPCTGEGLIVYKKERLLTRTMEDLRRMSSYQVELLLKAYKLLRPGGIMAYVTCSIAPEENELVLSRALEREEKIEILETRLEGASNIPGVEEFNGVPLRSEVRLCLRLYPHTDGTEGFFICLLRRKE
ncbi:MAG: RsmB/NOP family class I SAM-dependent RNA methyltransferase [Fervidicoccaceae archaeon]